MPVQEGLSLLLVAVLAWLDDGAKCADAVQEPTAACCSPAVGWGPPRSALNYTEVCCAVVVADQGVPTTG